MNSTYHKRAVGLFHSRDHAESAVRDLKNSGYNMQNVSIIAKDADKIDGIETTEKVGNKADDGAATGALTGGTLGGITGLLVGLGTLAIPGIGPILLAGAGATTIATTLAGVGIGAAAGGLVGALAGLGIPEERARVYSDSVKNGGFLVIVDGTTAEVGRADTILNRNGVQEFGIYDAPDVKSNAVTDLDRDTRTRSDLRDGVRDSDVNDRQDLQAATITDLDRDTRTRSDLRDGVRDSDVNDRQDLQAATITDVDEDIRSRADLSDGEKIRLYEERLTVNKQRAKTGEVSIGKRIKTDTANVSVPVEKERLVIERKNVTGKAVSSGVDFGDEEVVRIDLYEETATINKQAFVREEVNVRKEVETETIQKSETIRREELEIDTDGDVIQH